MSADTTTPPRGAVDRFATLTRRRSMWSQMPLWQCATRDQRRTLADAITQARQTAQQRRARVLAHPDIAYRLVTELGYSRPEVWNGYVPPLTAYITETYQAVPNDSPRRLALIDIVRAVAERERVS